MAKIFLFLILAKNRILELKNSKKYNIDKFIFYVIILLKEKEMTSFEKQEQKILAWAKELGLTEERKFQTKKSLNQDDEEMKFKLSQLYIFCEPDAITEGSENILRFAVINDILTNVKFLYNNGKHPMKRIMEKNKSFFVYSYDKYFNVYPKWTTNSFSVENLSNIENSEILSDFYTTEQVQKISKFLKNNLQENQDNLTLDFLMEKEKEFIKLQKNMLKELEYIHF